MEIRTSGIQGTLGFLFQLADRKAWIQQSSPWSSYYSRFLKSGFTAPVEPQTMIIADDLAIYLYNMAIVHMLHCQIVIFLKKYHQKDKNLKGGWSVFIGVYHYDLTNSDVAIGKILLKYWITYW